MESRYLHEIMNNRFHVLDEARQIRVNDRMHITFSIGVGDGGSTLAESEKFARQSLDMALGRGGDQAAVKTENGFCFASSACKLDFKPNGTLRGRSPKPRFAPLPLPCRN